jgi:hypothetical protein
MWYGWHRNLFAGSVQAFQLPNSIALNHSLNTEVSQTVGLAPLGRGGVGPLEGGRELFVWGAYLFWTKYGGKIYILVVTWLKYFTYHLVTILTPNYKQHILSPTKLRKICSPLSEICRSQWPCGLRRRSAAAGLLGSRIRIPLGA